MVKKRVRMLPMHVGTKEGIDVKYSDQLQCVTLFTV